MAEKLTTLAKRLRPFIQGQVGAISTTGALMQEGPGIDLIGNTIGLGGDTVLLYHIGGNPVTEYVLTYAGLTAALAVATTGEWVRINAACTITGDINIQAGVELQADSRAQVTIIGQVSMGTNSRLTRITVANAANSANALYGVVGPASGSAYLHDCDISAIQNGAGNAYAVGAINGTTTGNGHLYVDDCKLYGLSVSGDGYGGRSTRGNLYITGNTRGVYGSTDRFITT